MEELFATDKTRDLLPRITSFLVKEIYPLENADSLTGKFSKVAEILDQKRGLVKKLAATACLQDAIYFLARYVRSHRQTYLQCRGRHS